LGFHRAVKRIEAFAGEIVPVERFSTPSGEMFKFSDLLAVFRLLIEAYGLSEAAKHHPIEIYSSTDDAHITMSIGALRTGISFNDSGTVSPYMNRPC
jgi:hypothetical protein